MPHNAVADSLMDDISRFVEESTEAEILEEMIGPEGEASVTAPEADESEAPAVAAQGEVDWARLNIAAISLPAREQANQKIRRH